MCKSNQTKVLIIVAAAFLLATPAKGEDNAVAITTPPSLSGITWAGPVPSPASLKGKTVVAITYVTWCPKCNAWSGEMLSQIKQVIADRPVVVLAISTDTPPAEAVSYMQTRNFLAPNIFHGYDPTIAKRFGFTSKFFNYAVISPGGKIVQSGEAGGKYNDGKEPSYAAARQLSGIQDFGHFRFLKPEMSEALKQRLWLVELGASQSLNQDLKKMEKGLSTEDRDQLRKTASDFVEAEVKEMEELSKSEQVPDKLSAIEKAMFLNSQFAATPAGKRAKEVLSGLQKDATLKQEVQVKRQYETAMKIADEDRRAKTLEQLGKKYADTHFGKQAAEAAQAVTR